MTNILLYNLTSNDISIIIAGKPVPICWDLQLIKTEFIDDVDFFKSLMNENTNKYYDSEKRMVLAILFNKYLTAERKWKPI